jgi:integrase
MAEEAFLLNKKLKDAVADSTVAYYRKCLKRVYVYTGKHAAELTEPEMQKYLGTFTSDATYNVHLILLQCYLRSINITYLDSYSQRKLVDKDYPIIREDVAWLIDACKCPRDKALVAVLAQFGFRESEAVSINLSGVEWDEERSGGVYLTCQTSKTKIRKVLGLGANLYLRAWLAQHPDPQNPAAPLFAVQHKIGYTRMQTATVRRVFQRARVVAKAKHPGMHHVHPHALRHFCTTEEARQGLSEIDIKKRRGWSPNSTMLSHYLHVTAQDANDAYARAAGKFAGEARPAPEVACPKCRASNLPGAQTCANCGAPMDLKTAQALDLAAKLEALMARLEKLESKQG